MTHPSQPAARAARVAEGRRHSVQLNGPTFRLLRELLNLRRDVYGADALLHELLTAELLRRRELRRPA
jgi:hypothetical protein